jgi:hypothetical protein
MKQRSERPSNAALAALEAAGITEARALLQRQRALLLPAEGVSATSQPQRPGMLASAWQPADTDTLRANMIPRPIPIAHNLHRDGHSRAGLAHSQAQRRRSVPQAPPAQAAGALTVIQVAGHGGDARGAAAVAPASATARGAPAGSTSQAARSTTASGAVAVAPADGLGLSLTEVDAIAASLVADLEARLPDLSFMLLPTLLR